MGDKLDARNSPVIAMDMRRDLARGGAHLPHIPWWDGYIGPWFEKGLWEHTVVSCNFTKQFSFYETIQINGVLPV